MQKPVIGFLALQTVILLFLVYHVNSMQKRVDILSADIASMATQTTDTVKAATSYPTSTPVMQNTHNSDQFRQIIREELKPLLNNIQTNSGGESKPAVRQSADMDPREVARIKAAASSQIAVFTAQGSASSAELAAFERNIAKLPISEQKKVLGELSQAINSGQVKARF